MFKNFSIVLQYISSLSDNDLKILFILNIAVSYAVVKSLSLHSPYTVIYFFISSSLCKNLKIAKEILFSNLSINFNVIFHISFRT